MNNDRFEKTDAQAQTFQKIWMETLSKMMQAGLTFTPNAPPPEVLRQIRSGIFQALAESWDKFLRSPEFLQSMKQWMEQTVALRKMSNDFLGKVRNELQAPSRDDIDSILLALRHLEKRLLDRIEQLPVQTRQSKVNVTKPRKKTRGKRSRPETRSVPSRANAVSLAP